MKDLNAKSLKYLSKFGITEEALDAEIINYKKYMSSWIKLQQLNNKRNTKKVKEHRQVLSIY